MSSTMNGAKQMSSSKHSLQRISIQVLRRAVKTSTAAKKMTTTKLAPKLHQVGFEVLITIKSHISRSNYKCLHDFISYLNLFFFFIRLLLITDLDVVSGIIGDSADSINRPVDPFFSPFFNIFGNGPVFPGFNTAQSIPWWRG